MTTKQVPAIGLMIDWLEPTYQLLVLEGALDAARERGVSLVCFTDGLPGGGPSPVWPVYDIIGRESIAGLIVLGTSMAFWNDGTRQRLLHSVRRFPRCFVGLEHTGASSVCINNETGIAEPVKHLAEVHGCRHIAYLGGPGTNVEARQRLAGFRAAMAAHGLVVDERLVLTGDFTVKSGERAVRTLLDDHRVSIHDVDAVVAANDGMAWGCIDALAARSIRVPWQLAVTGFDDAAAGRQAQVPLTTMRQPARELGRKAVELLLAQIGGAAPERALLPTELVTRRSCGCLEGIGRLSFDEADLQRRGGRSFEVALLERREAIVAEMQRASRGQLGALRPGWEMRLVTALVDELKGRSADAFRLALSDGLDRVVDARGDPNAFHEVASALWRHLIPCVLGDPALRTNVEGLLDGARLAVSAAALRVMAAAQYAQEASTHELVDVCIAVSASATVEELAAVVEQRLSAVGISRLAIALFPEGHVDETVRRVLSLDRGKARLEPAEIPTGELPARVLSGARRSDLLVSALHANGHVIGVVCMQLEPVDRLVHDAIREAMSRAWHRLSR